MLSRIDSADRTDAGVTELPRYTKRLPRERGKVSRHSGLVVLIHKQQVYREPFYVGGGSLPGQKRRAEDCWGPDRHREKNDLLRSRERNERFLKNLVKDKSL